MKKLTFTAFVAFCSFIATVLALGVLVPERGIADHGELPAISAAELAEHDHEASCWMAIEGKVYDLTDYLPAHPTPLAIMLPWCGREATEGMRTKGYGRDHSPAAWSMLDDYLVGTYADE